MCYAIPGKIIEIKGDTATVDYGGVRKSANISFVDVNMNDYILVHAGFAIQKLDNRSAKESLKEIGKMTELMEDE